MPGILLAVELISAYQGVQFRKPARLGNSTSRLEALAAEKLAPVILEEYRLDKERCGWGIGSADEFREYLRKAGLAPEVAAQIHPCIGEDITLYPVVQAAADFVRMGGAAG